MNVFLSNVILKFQLWIRKRDDTEQNNTSGFLSEVTRLTISQHSKNNAAKAQCSGT